MTFLFLNFCNIIIADDEELARFKQKFAHLSEFFELSDAIRGQNNTFSLGFQCKSCEDKIVRAASSSTHNLTRHMKNCHPEVAEQFLTLRGNKRNFSSTTVSIEMI